MREETFSGPWLEVWNFYVLERKTGLFGLECYRYCEYFNGQPRCLCSGVVSMNFITPNYGIWAADNLFRSFGTGR